MTLRDKVKRAARKGRALLKERLAPDEPTPIFTTTSVPRDEPPAPPEPPAPVEAPPTEPTPAPADTPPDEPASEPPPANGEARGEALRPELIESLRQVYDPELPVNIYDLQMVYEIRVLPGDLVEIDMTLTSPGCPMAGSIVEDVRRHVEAVEGVRGTTVNLVWEPPWSPDRLTDDVRLELGMF